MYYANGFFSAKSTTILTKKEYETLLKTSTEAFFTQLRNLGFGLFTSIDELYNQNINLLKKDLDTTCGEIEQLKVFFYPIDLVNTKLIYKQIYQNIDTDRYFIEGGNLTKETIYNALKNKDYKNLNNEKDLFANINKLDKVDFKEANIKIEHYFYEFMQSLVSQMYPLNKYLETKINLLNILSIIRGQALNGSEKDVLNSIIITNSFDNHKAQTLFKANLSNIEEYVEKMGYLKASEAIKQYRQHLNIEQLQLDIDKSFYDLMINYTYSTNDYGYIMMYVYRKIKELENIKLIYFNRNINLQQLFLLEQ